ncbi:hypothetical protein EV207_11855 [Scopulibacillus darangshiensis]|uniref:Uncharacterized protein n=1 Tax=Scopulibacillus darangshiensis TaxID=442528 RepID=A0A4R2NYB3_9BACL|nr:hypothetical protein [Scopulibacillus darangshiensis]TCP27077.1 hypothetical protein EV207_11855 [Scopulibacillus darangshiensis]
MNQKLVSMLLIGGSILTLAVVLMLAHVASSIKEAAWFAKSGGSISYENALHETPFAVYILILIVLVLGVLLVFQKK